MKELGDYLRRTRISKGVSITEACYELKDSVRAYAKYLGLNPDKVTDEFNDFLFQHTTKISLDDIVAAQKKKEENDKKVKSPYTREYKEKANLWPLAYFLVGVIVIFVIIYIVVNSVNKVPTRINELQGKEISYEYTY